MQKEPISLSFVNSPPVVDGALDDLCWKAAQRRGGFITNWPEAGEEPSMQTEVQACYDQESLYFAFRCYDSEPEAISAVVANRDAMGVGDRAYVILDTDAEGSSGVIFFVNAAGSRGDCHVSDDGLSLDFDWDAEWSAGAAVNGEGWSAEIAVPFRELRFIDGENPRCAVNFGRFVYRLEEESLASRPPGSSTNVKLIDAIPMDGLKGPFDTTRFTIIPSITSRTFTDPVAGGSSSELEFGIDAKTRIGSGMVLDAAFNPDFAEIGADPNYVNLSRYETYYSERRPLFSERNDLFDTPLQLFYSRRVGKKLADGSLVPILFGAKLTGKVDRFSIAALHSITEETTFIDPWSGESVEPGSQYSVFRLARAVGAGSEIGVTTTHARGSSDREVVAGGDAFLEIGRDWNLTGQLVESYGDGVSGKAAYAKIKFHDNYRSASLSYRHVGNDFSAGKLGYVPWAGEDRYLASAYLTRNPGKHGIRSVNVGSGGSVSRYDGDPWWSWRWNPRLSLTTMSNWKGWAAAGVGRSVFLDAAHETGSWGAGIESSSGRDLWVSVDLGGGTMLDYSRAETVEFSSASANSHVSIGHHLTIATSAYRMWEHTPGDEEIVWTTMSILPRYSLSDRSYLRLSAQGIDASNWGGSWYDRAWLDINLLLCHRWRNLTLQGGWNRSGTWNEGEWAILTKASVRTWL